MIVLIFMHSGNAYGIQTRLGYVRCCFLSCMNLACSSRDLDTLPAGLELEHFVGPLTDTVRQLFNFLFRIPSMENDSDTAESLGNNRVVDREAVDACHLEMIDQEQGVPLSGHDLPGSQYFEINFGRIGPTGTTCVTNCLDSQPSIFGIDRIPSSVASS